MIKLIREQSKKVSILNLSFFVKNLIRKRKPRFFKPWVLNFRNRSYFLRKQDQAQIRKIAFVKVVSRILRTFQRDLIYTRFSLLLAPPVLKLIDSYSYIA